VANELDGMKIAILAADGVEQAEVARVEGVITFLQEFFKTGKPVEA